MWRAPAGGPLTLVTAGSHQPPSAHLTTVSESVWAASQGGAPQDVVHVAVDAGDGLWFWDPWAGGRLRRADAAGSVVEVTEPMASAAPLVSEGQPLAGHCKPGTLGLSVDRVGTLYLVRTDGASPRPLWAVPAVVPTT